MCQSVIFVFLLFGTFLIPLEAVIEKYLKPSVSPCEDFYQYACGKWNEVNSNIENGDTLSLLDATMNEKVSGFLESKEDHGVLKKVTTFYESCRNLEDYNMNLFLKAIKPQSDWAVSSSWDKTKFSWLQTLAELNKNGAQIFLEHTIMPRWDNSSVNIIYIDVVAFHPSSEESINAILKKASINSSSLAEEIIEFEKLLAPIVAKSQPYDEDNEAEEVVLGYLGEALQQINWYLYFNTVFGHEMDPYTPIIIQNLDIVMKIAELLNSSKPDLVCNYIMFKFLQFLDQYSIDSISPNECVTALHQGMPLAVDHIIENHFYEHDYDQLVQDLFNYLKVEFLAGVSKLYEDQRDVLLFIYTKTSVMDLQIGNADRNMTSDAVAKYYAGLDIKEGDFYNNFLEALKYKTTKYLKSINGDPIHIAYQWSVTSSPFFLQPRNKIIVPYSLLQEGIFGKDITTNKYSVLGFIIGHEFLHGFDTNGISYDYTGSMVQSALSCNQKFWDSVQCVQEEMGNSGVTEKIADIGGIRLAYNAFQRSLIQVGKNIMGKETEADRSLGQSFFIDYAQFFCGKTKKSAKGLPGRDVHDADDLRIKRSLMSFNTFANAFECPVGSVMNPEKKCRVW
ncbi:membrane metallo-endopeptidase-like 1 [Episyrphus balteatus]|uniref:membrane metallo-endopeptidase-like 1 n=1 Tax=Episyrphus balteatus TaxID=286459 RepID=UPI0024856799|nr:membrane metallo-endopeptidase-like 1 [Episyrphus balteatus]